MHHLQNNVVAVRTTTILSFHEITIMMIVMDYFPLVLRFTVLKIWPKKGQVLTPTRQEMTESSATMYCTYKQRYGSNDHGRIESSLAVFERTR